MKLNKRFFNYSADVVAKNLLGKILCRKSGKSFFYAKIVETEAYFGEKDSASWARFGKRKDNLAMWSKAGTIMIKNVHKHYMMNFVTGKKGDPQAVLIRALEPINFSANCSGPGLLTKNLMIDKSFNEKSIFNSPDIKIIDSEEKISIQSSYRIGVKKDLRRKLRFFIKGNKYVSRKNVK